jgi:hypothetical protein
VPEFTGITQNQTFHGLLEGKKDARKIRTKLNNYVNMTTTPSHYGTVDNSRMRTNMSNVAIGNPLGTPGNDSYFNAKNQNQTSTTARDLDGRPDHGSQEKILLKNENQRFSKKNLLTQVRNNCIASKLGQHQPMNHNHVNIRTTNDKKPIKKKVISTPSNILGRQDSVATLSSLDKHCKPCSGNPSITPKTYSNFFLALDKKFP